MKNEERAVEGQLTKNHPVRLIDAEPEYSTQRGAAFVGDSLELIKLLPSRSINAIITSPPYALTFKKSYGNPKPSAYIDWFLQFAPEFKRILRKNGSLIIEIGGVWNKGEPTRSVYHFELLVKLVREYQFHLAEEFYWFNKARIPGPAEWVNVQRVRVKDAVTPIWWLGVTPTPAADNRRVLIPYSPQMERLFSKGYNRDKRPSGHVANKFENNNGGAIPPNLIQVAHTVSNDPYQLYCRAHDLPVHPARFPQAVPEFFVKLLTQKGGLVLDPFGGSNMTGFVAEKLGRRWLTFEREPEFMKGSLGRFLMDETLKHAIVRGRRAA